MKKIALWTLGASLLVSATAAAGTLDEILANGMTIEAGSVTYTVTLSDDGSYTTDIGIEGSWEESDDGICFTRSTGESNCQPIPEGKASGDSWSGENAAGETVTVTIN